MRIRDKNANIRSVGRFLWGMTAIVALMTLSAALSMAQPESRTGTDSARAGGAKSAQAEGGERPGGTRGPQTPYIMPPITQSLFADLHNKIIHFPIVLNLVAVVLVIVSRRRPELEPVAFWLVWFALLATLAAFFSGLAQATEFEHRPKGWLVNTHRNWGIALAVTQCIWVLTLLKPRTRGFATVWSLVVAALVLVTGFLGGLVAHGHSAAPPSSVRVEAK